MSPSWGPAASDSAVMDSAVMAVSMMPTSALLSRSSATVSACPVASSIDQSRPALVP